MEAAVTVLEPTDPRPRRARAVPEPAAADLVGAILARRRRRVRRQVVLVACVLAATATVALGVGQLAIPPWQVVAALVGDAGRAAELAVTRFRLPRVALAVALGAGLGVAGGAMQGAARNGLVDPGILGVNSGAGLGVIFAFAFAGTVVPLSPWTVPVAAFAGGLGTAALVWALARRGGQVRPYRLVLVGVAVGLGLGALTLLIAAAVDPEVYRAAAQFGAGSLSGRGWTALAAALPWFAVCIPVIFRYAPALDVLAAGDDVARSLGIDTDRVRRRVVGAAVGATCAAAAVGGAISFVGLVAPHVARRLVGPRHGPMLAVAGLAGGVVVLVADTLGRLAVAPGELPAGLVAGLLGAPWFLYLLVRCRG